MSEFFSDEYDPLKPKKKRVNGKQKGIRFERTIAKLFEQWAPEYKFQRVPGSGNAKWGEAEGFKGDVTALGFPLCIEAKNLADTNLMQVGEFMAASTEAAMQQSTGDALRVNKIPVVLRNYKRKIYFIVPMYDKAQLQPGWVVIKAKKLAHKEYMIYAGFAQLAATQTFNEFWENYKKYLPEALSHNGAADGTQP
jgi:hypothetical protein